MLIQYNYKQNTILNIIFGKTGMRQQFHNVKRNDNKTTYCQSVSSLSAIYTTPMYSNNNSIKHSKSVS